MAATRRTRSVSLQAAGNYLSKAREFAASMEASLKGRQWNAAALAAFVRIRSSEQDHRQIVTLLADHLGKNGEQASKHVQRVIALKNLVEYEERLIRQAEANQMATHVRRLMALVESTVPLTKRG